MTILLFFVPVLVGLIAAAPVVVGAIRKQRLSPYSAIVVAATTLAILRVGALWFLIYLEWTNQQTLSALPLILLLYPEVLLVPATHSWTLGSGLVFSIALVAGSAVVGAVAAGLTAIYRWAGHCCRWQ